ncbi:hypothetical protein [Actinoplanes sp. CA-252034]|uniref:hypothetical protein n=1 Tax=Actinoplanes sp. CA-252034 TaxID=3239906 RepID=UPI003D969F52
MDMAFQEGFGAAGGEDAMNGLAGEGEPEREQHAGHRLAAQVDHDLTEVGFGFGGIGGLPSRPADAPLRSTRSAWFPSRRDAPIRYPSGDQAFPQEDERNWRHVGALSR